MTPAAKVARLSMMAALCSVQPIACAIAASTMGANTPAVAQQWRDIANLPDWSGTWDPDRAVERSELNNNPIPWNTRAQAQIDLQKKQAAAGNPKLILWGCFPHGMPSWMMINHNLMEILFTPGRVTMLGEVDGNRLRRIYTDGRSHPEDPDPTFHGHSIGKWEGDTLVVDTVGIAPQAPIAPHETIGLPNNGDMHIVERIRLRDSSTLENFMVITAPRVLTKPWTTTRVYQRLRGVENEIVEGQCVRGDYEEGVDENGNAIFAPFTAPEQDAAAPQSDTKGGQR